MLYSFGADSLENLRQLGLCDEITELPIIVRLIFDQFKTKEALQTYGLVRLSSNAAKVTTIIEDINANKPFKFDDFPSSDQSYHPSTKSSKHILAMVLFKRFCRLLNEKVISLDVSQFLANFECKVFTSLQHN